MTLQDVIVSQSVAVQRKTPVAVSTVTADEITYKLGGQEFPEILKSTPGVYVTKDGGGFGDAKINMRGFQSANVAVMVNGVPVNDMEWGGVYWSNWAGLSDVTRSMQTQRGLGASKISAPSVGGSVNIVTNGIDAKKGGTFSFGVGNDGLYNLSLSLSTGLTKNGWAMSILAAKRWGDGYIQGTNFEGYNWFVNISKRINDRHQLSLTAFGAPQKHGQRNALNDGLTIAEWQKAKNFMGEKDMYRYNASYGFDKNGKQRYSSFNEYHKPQISLNHQWQIDYKSSLSTALYMSIGRGSGYSGQGRTSADRNAWKGTNYGILNTTFRNPDGTFAYDKIQELNAASIDGSRMVMSKSNNNHMGTVCSRPTPTRSPRRSSSQPVSMSATTSVSTTTRSSTSTTASTSSTTTAAATSRPRTTSPLPIPRGSTRSCRWATRSTATTTDTSTKRAYSHSSSGRATSSTHSSRVRSPTPDTGATTASTTMPNTPSRTT